MGYVMPLLEIVVYSGVGIAMGIVCLVCTLVQHKTNRTINQEIKFFSKTFGKARKYIYIQTDMDKRFFNNSKVIKSFVEAAKNGVIIRIFADPKGEKIENVPELKKLVDEKVVEIKVAKASFREMGILHLMAVDSKTVRIEPYHKPLKLDEDKISFEIIWKNYPFLAQHVELGFEKLWKT